jgi:hypothetical protein
MPAFINEKFEVGSDLPDATADGLTITWTANEPTASSTQTIADGTTPTVAELGQAIKNLNAQIDKLIADNAAAKATLVS